MRINRFLAAAGAGSRRSVEALILQGAVKINGAICNQLATEVGALDEVRLNGRIVRPQTVLCFAMNKPKGYLCTRSDEKKRRTIYDLLPDDLPRVVSIGRLDMESEGLILLTNDGDLNLRLSHPRFKMEKEYDVTLDKPFDAAGIPRLLKGIMMEGGRAKAERVVVHSPRSLTITLKQGLKRQIRVMLYRLGYEVTRLRRTRIGPIHLGKIPSGKSRRLTPAEVQSLMAPQPKKDSAPSSVEPSAAEKTIRPRRPQTNRPRSERPSAKPGQNRRSSGKRSKLR